MNICKIVQEKWRHFNVYVDVYNRGGKSRFQSRFEMGKSHLDIFGQGGSQKVSFCADVINGGPL